ncbi:MAG: hypothetical protein KC484_08540 [Colwelliaceae bacterium]|jgi:hypothetical protein|nr:hypothetical protein [Colwelliaceae bacterium]
MKLFTNLILFILLLNSIGCSSTKTVNINKIEKRALISDHYLMMSLLNRPVTEDQKMMLAFAKVQDEYRQELTPIFVNAVMIKGEKSEKSLENHPMNIYSSLIAKDINAIRMSGPY